MLNLIPRAPFWFSLELNLLMLSVTYKNIFLLARFYWDTGSYVKCSRTVDYFAETEISYCINVSQIDGLFPKILKLAYLPCHFHTQMKSWYDPTQYDINQSIFENECIGENHDPEARWH